MLNATEVLKELQEMRDNGFLSDALMRHAVKQIKRADSRFDWVGVYLVNAEGDELWLHNYVGKGTEHARIAMGEGRVRDRGGRGEGQPERPRRLEGQELPGLLPHVESELVVLIRAGDEIYGQIDIDSDEKNAFSAEIEAEVQAIADKLAEQIAAERR
jgi:L-methionine (R)-S-oxide reductase